MEGTMLSHQLREKYNLPQNNIFKYFQMYQISSCILMGFPFKLWRRLFNLSLGFTKLRQFHQVTTWFSSNLSGKWIWERISWLMCGIRFGQVLQVAYLPTKPQSCSSWSNTGSKSHWWNAIHLIHCFQNNKCNKWRFIFPLYILMPSINDFWVKICKEMNIIIRKKLDLTPICLLWV